MKLEIKMSDMHSEKYEKTLEGSFEHSREKLRIFYLEENISTEINVSKEGVILCKKGSVQCGVIFEKGIKKPMKYQTAEITSFMDAKTHVIYYNERTFFINYDLYQGSEHINTIELKISKIEE
ncbi:MAG: DUF1934 family protein [Fusobacteria bacterium]|nr:DUF1934 family protein [Fusobacteriota bacterium]